MKSIENRDLLKLCNVHLGYIILNKESCRPKAPHEISYAISPQEYFVCCKTELLICHHLVYIKYAHSG